MVESAIRRGMAKRGMRSEPLSELLKNEIEIAGCLARHQNGYSQ